MIEASQLREIRPVYCYPKGDTVSFKAIKKQIGKVAKDFNIPVAFAYDTIKSVDGTSVAVEDCLVLYHPKHRHDYFNIVFRIRRDGDTAYIAKNDYGISPQVNRFYGIGDGKYNGTQQGIKLNEPSQRSGMHNGVNNDTLLEEEARYYLALKAVFEFLKC